MGRPIERFKPGDPILASRWNEIVDAIEDLANVQFGDGFEVQQGPNGRVVRLVGENEIMARLTATGTAGVYTWSEVYDDPIASWPTIPGGRSGVGNAYEVNRAPKCDGYVVRLRPCGTWYAFYVPMLGGAIGPCGCSLLPTTIEMYVASGVSAGNVVATFTYGPPPGGFGDGPVFFTGAGPGTVQFAWPDNAWFADTPPLFLGLPYYLHFSGCTASINACFSTGAPAGPANPSGASIMLGDFGFGSLSGDGSACDPFAVGSLFRIDVDNVTGIVTIIDLHLALRGVGDPTVEATSSNVGVLGAQIFP